MHSKCILCWIEQNTNSMSHNARLVKSGLIHKEGEICRKKRTLAETSQNQRKAAKQCIKKKRSKTKWKRCPLYGQTDTSTPNIQQAYFYARQMRIEVSNLPDEWSHNLTSATYSEWCMTKYLFIGQTIPLHPPEPSG